MRLPVRATALAALLVAPVLAWAQAAPAPTRGQLLYQTHCLDCHSTQVHWREGKQVRDSKSLRLQVRRWAQIGHLAWDDADVEEVARYLNDTIYRYPQPPEAQARP
jgi:mono/diheme cytochrome c family protein